MPAVQSFHPETNPPTLEQINQDYNRQCCGGYFFRLSEPACESVSSEGENEVKPHTPKVQGDQLELENGTVIFPGDYKRIFRYIASMVGDSSEAEDLTQESFLRAYLRRDTLRDAGAQTAWLYRIATHISLDRLRQYSRLAPKESDTDLDGVDIPDSDTPSLQQVIEQDEMSDCVQNYLNRLSDSYRAVIMLHDMHELTSPEIAQLLNESLSTIKIRLHRARLKLKSALEAGCSFSYDDRSVLTCESND